MCAVGVLIEDYDSKLEGRLVRTKEVQAALYSWAKPPNFNEETLLTSMQDVHDRYPVHMWADEVDKAYETFKKNKGEGVE